MKDNAKEYLFVEVNDDNVKQVFIITAHNKEEACHKAASIFAEKDSLFVEHMHDRKCGWGFPEIFMRDDDSSLGFFTEASNKQSDDIEFNKRVNKYFESKPSLAIEYLNYFHSDNEALTLSAELLIEVWIREWYDGYVIGIEDIERK